MQGIEYKAGQSEYGFRGIFDGLGHTISGLKVMPSGSDESYNRRVGLISRLHANGIIRNVAFTDAEVENGGFLVGWGEGLVENVYVQYKSFGQWSNYCTTFNVSADSAAHGVVTVKNALIDISQNNSSYVKGFVIGQSIENTYTYQNVYVVGANSGRGIVRYFSQEANDYSIRYSPLTYDGWNAYATAEELIAGQKTEINGWKYFRCGDTYVNYNGNKVLTASSPAATTTHKLINGTKSDYTIVYDKNQAKTMRAAGIIEKHLNRATATVTVTKRGNGTFNESVSGGVVIDKTSSAVYSSNANLIVIGNAELAKAAGVACQSGELIIKKVGNSVFILADDPNDYVAGALLFLEEVIGYKALSDDLVVYENVQDVIGDIDVSFDTAFNVRSQTNVAHLYKEDQLGFNGVRGVDMFLAGPTDDSGNVQPFHNSIYWLPQSTAESDWYRSDGVVDICYTAHGNGDSFNSMVNQTAINMWAVLKANPTAKELTFSLQDTDMDCCDCSACASANTDYGAYSGAAINFLNQVAAQIRTLAAAEDMADREFTIYMLAYYYLRQPPKNITIDKNVGVIYAPIRVGAESQSIYATVNGEIRSNIDTWAALTDNIGFWFYDMIYHDYMVPMDTFESMLTWIEYAANHTEAKWMYIQGQTQQRPNTAFESFKQYISSKALIEIKGKVGAKSDYSTDDAYTLAIQAYLAELENEFFGISSRNGSTEINSFTFADGGYYGVAAANKAMYQLYCQIRTDYQALVGSAKAGSSTMIGDVNENYDYIIASKYSTFIPDKTYSISDYLNNYSTYKYCYFPNFTTAKISAYMGYYETAKNAIESYTGTYAEVYKQHVLVESMFPRFIICMTNCSKSGYGWSSGYNGTSLANMRSAFKTDATDLGWTYYGEGQALSKVYSFWGV